MASAQEVSTKLGVSLATVKKVFQEMARQGYLKSQVGNGSFWMGFPDAPRRITIGINNPRVVSSALQIPGEAWTYRIYGGLTKVAMESPYPITLRSFGVGEDGQMLTPEQVDRELRELDGVFLLLSPYNCQLRQLALEAGCPVVSLNPVTVSDTTNFVSPAYYESSRVIGQAWRASGRKSILAIVAPKVSESTSIQLRLNGLYEGLGVGLVEGMQVKVLELEDGSEELSYRKLKYILEEGWLPDAILCAGDAQAAGAVHALLEKNIRVPEDCSVVGGNGLIPFLDNGLGLTRVVHPLEKLGEEAARMLIRIIKNGGGSVPGRSIPSPIAIGDTTTPEENRWLKDNYFYESVSGRTAYLGAYPQDGKTSQALSSADTVTAEEAGDSDNLN